MQGFMRLITAGLCAAAAASAVQAQAVRSLNVAPSTAPSSTTQANQALPQPGGLAPVFPSGLNSGTGAAASSDPIAASTSPVPPASTTTVTTGRDTLLVPQSPTPATNALGAGATARSQGQASAFRASEIVQSFLLADENGDGQLTRAEAARLSIFVLPFDVMDRDADGLVSRLEYEDSLR